MKKRIASALLWFYATWYVWAVIAHVAGLSELAGPVLGAAVAAFIAGDPMHRVWYRQPATPQRSATAGFAGEAA